MYRRFALAAASLLAAAPSAFAVQFEYDSTTGATRPADYEAVYVDQFNGTALDTDTWHLRKHETPRHGGLNTLDQTSIAKSLTSADAFGASDGSALRITTGPQIRHSNGNLYNPTAMIGTHRSLLFKYGYMEARVKFQTAPGHWSAFWMQSPGNEKYTDETHSPDPANIGTEIDIYEHTIHSNHDGTLRKKTQHAHHANGYGNEKRSWTGQANPDIETAVGGWNRFGLLWTEDKYEFYINGQLSRTMNYDISNAHSFLILSLEVANDELAGFGGVPIQSRFPDSLLVDYVSVYQPVGQRAVIELDGSDPNQGGSTGGGGGGPSTPEPTAFAALGLGALALLRRHRA